MRLFDNMSSKMSVLLHLVYSCLYYYQWSSHEKKFWLIFETITELLIGIADQIYK